MILYTILDLFIYVYEFNKSKIVYNILLPNIFIVISKTELSNLMFYYT